MQRPRSLRLTHALLAGVLVGFVLLTSGCGNSSAQQKADQYRAKLDQQLQQAKSDGIPQSVLQTVVRQEQQFSSASAPFGLFNDQAVTNFYITQANHYQTLLSQLQDAVASTTAELQGQAQQDVLNFQSTLAKPRPKNVGNLEAFSIRLTTDQSRLSTAHVAKEYQAISTDARNATTTLQMLDSTYTQLVTFHNTINQMKQAHLDVLLMQDQYTSDMGLLNVASTMIEFQSLGTLIDAQYQQAVVNSMQALPFVGAVKLGEFKAQLNLLKTYGMDASSYQKLYNADAASMKKANSILAYLKVSNKIDVDMSSMHDDLVQGASNYLISDLDRKAHAWGNAHLYHNKFDGKSYILDSPYTMDGIGFWLKRELSWAWQPSDFQSVVDDDNSEFFNFQMFQQDYGDTTPYNQVHATDLKMFQHYPSLQHGTVIMVSLVEQAMRFFKNGKLVRSFYVTTGRVERPALPGVWTVQDRKSPDEFKSSDPPGSPFWYPPTPIHYAILYHWGGFFVHDSWWRANYGPGTQFPHYDTSGDEAFSGNGSHGCVNMQEDQAAWVYANTDWTTQIAIY